MLDERTLLRGAIFGVIAALAGYVATYGLRLTKIDAATSEGGQFYADGLGPASWKVAGWLWAGTHHVTVEVTRGTLWYGYNTGTTPTFGDIWTPTLFAVPVVLLVLAGALVADPKAAVRGAVMQGAGVTLGYAPVAMGALYLFRWESALPEDWRIQSIAFALDPVVTVVMMGLTFPLLFGALGGRLRHAIGR